LTVAALAVAALGAAVCAGAPDANPAISRSRKAVFDMWFSEGKASLDPPPLFRKSEPGKSYWSHAF
jgi:hypothetical protein